MDGRRAVCASDDISVTTYRLLLHITYGLQHLGYYYILHIGYNISVIITYYISVTTNNMLH